MLTEGVDSKMFVKAPTPKQMNKVERWWQLQQVFPMLNNTLRTVYNILSNILN